MNFRNLIILLIFFCMGCNVFDKDLEGESLITFEKLSFGEYNFNGKTNVFLLEEFSTLNTSGGYITFLSNGTDINRLIFDIDGNLIIDTLILNSQILNDVVEIDEGYVMSFSNSGIEGLAKFDKDYNLISKQESIENYIDTAYNNVDSIVINDIHYSTSKDEILGCGYVKSFGQKISIAIGFDLDLNPQWVVPHLLDGENYSIANQVDHFIVVGTLYIDSTFLVFETIDTTALFDTVSVTLNNIPIPDFSIEIVCFPDSSLILNNSSFNPNSTVTYLIDNTETISDTSQIVSVYLGENGINLEVYAEIVHESGCLTFDEFTISNKKTPSPHFQINETCENVIPQFDNLSTNTDSMAVYMIFDGFEILQSGLLEDLVEFNDTLPEESYEFGFVVTNSNGCIDTSFTIFDILPVTYISFLIEDTSGVDKNDLNFCIGDPNVNLFGSENGGVFTGFNVESGEDGTGFFKLLEEGSNIPITYSFENSFGCVDDHLIPILNVYPLPNVFFSGLDTEYCVFDSLSTLIGSHQGASFDPLNEQVLLSISDTSYHFDPFVIGNFELVYSY